MWKTLVGLFRKDEKVLEDPRKSVEPIESPCNIDMMNSSTMHPPRTGYFSARVGKTREIDISGREENTNIDLGSSARAAILVPGTSSNIKDDRPEYVKKVEFWQMRNRAAFAKRKPLSPKAELYRKPILCVKKWVGKDIVYEYSKKAQQIEKEYSIPKGSKHYLCVERPKFGYNKEESKNVGTKRPSKPYGTDNAKKVKQF